MIEVLNEPVLLHKFLQFLVGYIGLVGLIVDGDERDVRSVGLNKHGVRDDPRPATLTFSLRGYREAHLAQVLAKRLALQWRLAQRVEEVAIVILHRRVALGELLQFAGEGGCGINLTVH